MRQLNPKPPSSRVEGAKAAARARLRDLLDGERTRARAHIGLIRRGEPDASSDRVAQVLLERWTRVAQVEGGVTGALGFVGVPVNLLLFVYFEVAVIVSIAEAYGKVLEGEPGEDVVIEVLARVHGFEDVVRSTPRVLGAIARTVALRHGFATLGRFVPLLAAPIAARLNEREMQSLGVEALRRFGNVVAIE